MLAGCHSNQHIDMMGAEYGSDGKELQRGLHDLHDVEALREIYRASATIQALDGPELCCLLVRYSSLKQLETYRCVRTTSLMAWVIHVALLDIRRIKKWIFAHINFSRARRRNFWGLNIPLHLFAVTSRFSGGYMGGKISGNSLARSSRGGQGCISKEDVGASRRLCFVGVRGGCA